MIDSLSDKDLLQQFSSEGLEALRNNPASSEDEITSRKIESCQLILEIMNQHKDFSKICPFNTKRFRGNLLPYLDHWKNKPHSLGNLDELFVMCMAFSREYLLFQERNSIPLHIKINHYWRQFKTDIEQKQYSFKEGYLKTYVQYILNEMDLDILNSFLGQKDYQAFLNYEKTVEEAENKINKLQTQLHNEEERFNSKISEREEKVDNLKASLENFQTAFNFIGLSQGFENLLKKKEKAKSLTFWGLFVLLITALVPVGYSFGKFIFDPNYVFSWEKMLPVIGLEFVLIYFFRVVLTHYHSIQTQIMQLELRQSLCQFIQSYADYAKEIKASDKDALEKFENLIFSSILSNPDKVPGTFDGIDGLTSLLKELKSK
ncbi:hypothetical protein [Neisseria animaloris]|uniref:hypothetical protein n=1 Tax=Neisseria animaloris TaxID=326522 RepID=UPI0039E0F3E7